MTDGKTGLITPGSGGIEPVDPDWPREGWPGRNCDGKGLIIEGFGG